MNSNPGGSVESSTSNDLSQQAIVDNARGMKGWLKFLGILMIISGALQALSIVGIIVAWLPIWLGVILNQAGSRAGEYVLKHDAASLAALTSKLKTYFVVMGVMVIVSFALTIVGGIVLLATGIFAGGLPALLEQYGYS
jgi:hypothetical protein